MAESWKDDLTSLFEPGVVAIIGASERSHYCVLCMESLAQLGFPEERVYLVNPGRPEAFGRPTYPDLSAVPGPVDQAILIVNRDRTIDAYRQCVAKGVRSIVMLASGFAEADEEGARIQREFTELAAAHQLLVNGPNCTGVVNLTAGYAAYDGAGRLPAGHGSVGVIFQSGGLMNPLMETASNRALGVGKMVSVGNAAVLAVEDYLSYFVRDPGTSLILSYVESMRDAARGMAAIERAAEIGKPIVMIKAGRSSRGRRAAASHTASIVASGRAWEGALTQKGVILVDGIDELVETGALLALTGGRSFSGRLGFVTISGGDTSLFCDLVDKHGLELPELEPETFERLKRLTGKPSMLGNPLDMGGSYRFGTPEFVDCFEAFIGDPNIDVVAVRLNLPKAPTDSVLGWLDELKAACGRAGKFLVVFSRATERWADEWSVELTARGIPFLSEFDRGCLALRRWSEYSQFKDSYSSDSAVHAVAVDVPTRAGLWLYGEAEALLRDFGVPMARTITSGSVDDAVKLAGDFDYPVVVKVDSRDIAHRNAIGGVVVGVPRADGIASAAETIYANVSTARPDAIVSGIIVQEMKPAKLELIVGIAPAGDLGPVVLVGAGGVTVEHDPDVAMGYPPLSRVEASRLLRRLRIWSSLDRLGEQAENAVLDVVCAVSDLAAAARGSELQVDLNPVLVDATSAVAVDALVSTANVASESAGLL